MCKLKKGEKLVKARKDHRCDKCNGILHKGRKYIQYKTRLPDMLDEYEQVGIFYVSLKYHLNRKCDGILPYVSDVKKYFKGCCKGKHEIFSSWDEDGDFEGYYCGVCFIELDFDGNNKNK